MNCDLKLISILLAILFIISTKSRAQTNNNQLEFTYIEGIKVISPDYTIHGKIWGGELAYHFNMQNDKQDYVKFLEINSIDIVGSYRNLKSLYINNNPLTKDSLGEAYSILGRLEVQLLKFGPVKLLFTPGFGFTYSTTSYFTDGNRLVGSKINLAAQAGIKTLYSITSSTGIQAGIDLLHFSNGGERLPNNGINSINISFGLVQSINRAGPSTPKNPFEYNGTNSLEFSIDFGERGLFRTKKELYRSGLYAGYSYRLNSVFSLRGGVDAGYYFTPFNPNNYDNTFENYGTSYARWRLGVSAGGDIRLGRLAVFANYGYYLYYQTLYQPKTDYSRELDYRVKTYFTPGLRYYVCQWIALQVKQYINHQSADYLGLGALFRIY
ncbi:MAG TPA: acyloxyacyl hydrolase [Mucilaginibacter sp.]